MSRHPDNPDAPGVRPAGRPPGEWRIGIVGVGSMGSGMAARLLGRGWPVAVRDLDPARTAAAAALGATVCATSAELAARCNCVIISVVDAQQIKTVLFGPHGLAETLAPGAAVVLCPTIAPDEVERFERQLRRRGLGCIDAPMSGGPARARDGSMTLMVACNDDLFERHRPLFESLCGRLLRVGARPGDAARTKLVNNLLAGIHLAAAAEVMALARRIGLDPAVTLEVIEQSSGQSWIASDRLRRALAGDRAVHAQTALLAKNTRLALQMARAAGVDLPLGTRAAALYASACEDGLAALDDSSLCGWLGGPARRQPAADQPADGHPAADEPADDHPAADHPAAGAPGPFTAECGDAGTAD